MRIDIRTVFGLVSSDHGRTMFEKQGVFVYVRGMSSSTPRTTLESTAGSERGIEGRRARQRRELLEAIDVEARRLLFEGGPSNVSMRAIARAVGMGPASLYTYFDGLDDIFTMLLLSSYGRLAASTAAAVDRFANSPPADRVLVGILAYRRWALDHRNEFNLLFTDQLPGYAAPPGGPTIAAQTAVFQPIVDALLEISPGESASGGEADVLLAVGIPVWTTFHGAVSLEVNNHLDWIPDTADLHERVVRAALSSFGVPPAGQHVRGEFDRWTAAAVGVA